jgi:hypothetical protein
MTLNRHRRWRNQLMMVWFRFAELESLGWCNPRRKDH